MKRVFSVFVISALVCSLFAGCGSRQNTTTNPSQSQTGTTNPGQTTQPTTPTTTAPDASNAPASALQALESVWDLFAEEEQFWVVGGGYNNPVDNAPGAVELTDVDYMTFSLLIPDAEQDKITEAASMMHAMNGNNFTCGVYKVADVTAFANAMQAALEDHQWVCGMPEQLKIVDLGGGYVLVAFGIGDAMNPFFGHLVTAYPQAHTLVDVPVV